MGLFEKGFYPWNSAGPDNFLAMLFPEKITEPELVETEK